MLSPLRHHRPLAPPLYVALLCAATIASCGRSAPAPAEADLRTAAEQSGFQKTGRYDEVERLCAAYARTWPGQVTCTEFGRTPEGRPMLALAASGSGALTPEQARMQNLPVVLIQGGIHGGEIDGKDAGFLALTDLLDNRMSPGAWRSFVLVFVPVFNVDGHERFGRNNRPNQTGPEEMGWRTTAQNFNLNRDYTKADAPEMQAMLRLLDAWDPILYVDLHVTDGAQFEHDVSNTMEPIYVGDPELHPTTKAILAELNRSLTASGSLPLDFYPDFVRPDDPASGFAAAANSPRFSTGYWPLRNRFSLLVETHSWKDYPTRVRITRNVILEVASMMAAQGQQWQQQVRDADARAAQLAGQDVPLDYQTGPHTRTIEFRGYAYTREPSPISGTLATKYDTSKPEIWRVPLYDMVTPRTMTKAPMGGYIVPAALAGWVGEKLALHGVQSARMENTIAAAEVETFRVDAVKFSAEPFESHTTAAISGTWRPERRAIPAGSLFVPIAQPNARLILTLLEPQSSDSFAAWGFFNSIFERKEYMEGYVTEQVAAEMLKDPAVAAEFRKRLAEDKTFAADPGARLDFFYRRHPSFDERLNLYPIYRVATSP